MAKILVVDDERSVRQAFEEILSSKGHTVVSVRGAEDAMGSLQKDDFDLVILDICLPGMNGLDALGRIKQRQPKLPVIVMTGQGTTDTAIEATKRGAFDYQLKPFEPAEMLRTIAKALEGSRLMKGECGPRPGDGRLLRPRPSWGAAAAMQQLYKAIGRVAQTDATVLIRGESGTGKELVARAIYQHSLRSGRPLMVVNCAAIPETLLESELFGYEPGAFTGAATRRIGKFEQAHGGTIFLDEIGDMPVAGPGEDLADSPSSGPSSAWAAMKRFMSTCRVLCATNRNLEKAIADGGFREDLYHRLNVVTLQLPPLRDRREDIPLLVDYFLNRCARTSHVERPPLCPECVGSARPLRLARQRAGIGTPDSTSDDLHGRLHDPGQRPSTTLRAIAQTTTAGAAANLGDEPLLELVQSYLDAFGGDNAYEKLVDKIERLLITEALRRSQGNQSRTSRLLGLPRPTLHAKIQKFGLQGPGAPQ